jgi:predicted RNA-binding protein
VIMSTRNYWINLFTTETWDEFVTHGATTTGFSESRWSTVQKIKRNDYLLCYLTKVSRFIGVLEVISEPYQDDQQIWTKAIYPSRVDVRPIVRLTPETAVPITDLRNELSIFQGITNPNAWSGHVRGSPTRWKNTDGEIVLKALQLAQTAPIEHPVPQIREDSIQTVTSPHGTYTVPADEETEAKDSTLQEERSETEHDEIQWMLLKLGNDMGLDVWVARNDRNRAVGGNRFTDLPRLRRSLPLQFDQVTNRIIEYIDVLWLSGNAVVAAFEIESTTSIYSGLLRMSDLVAMQPNLNIPLYIVAPDERHAKVIEEINRPTFVRREPPLHDVCQLIRFSTLRREMPTLASMGPYLKPQVLDRLSEDCSSGVDE